MFGRRVARVEACNIPTWWSCRTGACHTCESGLVAGTVSYRPDPIDPPAASNVLVCCSQPHGDVVIDLLTRLQETEETARHLADVVAEIVDGDAVPEGIKQAFRLWISHWPPADAKPTTGIRGSAYRERGRNGCIASQLHEQPRHFPWMLDAESAFKVVRGRSRTA